MSNFVPQTHLEGRHLLNIFSINYGVIAMQAPYSTQQLEEAAQPGSSAAQVALSAGRAAVPDQATSSQSGQLQPSTAATEAGSYGEAAQTSESATAGGQQEGGEDDVYYDALDGTQHQRFDI